MIPTRVRWALAACCLLLALPLAAPAAPVAGLTAPTPPRPQVVLSAAPRRSPPLRELPALQVAKARGQTEERPTFLLPKALRGAGEPELNTQAQDVETFRAQALTPSAMPAPLLSFEGVGNLFGGWPPDTQGDIGPNHYVQWNNLHFAIWQIDKVNHTATLVYGPAAGNTLWQGQGGACAARNDGDPITLYDRLADRWFMSQFALPNFPNGPFYHCVAVSQTNDPTGAWYVYTYQMPVNKMNDYPKFGVWPDAYYMTVNQFSAGTLNWAGAGAGAFERDKMLNGQPAQLIYFDLFGVDPNLGGMLPADLDGPIPPPPGAAGLFVQWDDSAWIGAANDMLSLWEFHADWADPSSSTFGSAGQPNQMLVTQDVNPEVCANFTRNCIPQPNTTQRLDAISDRLMHRLQYRNFGAYAALVSNHTVNVSGLAGVHWFELRDAGGGWFVQQEGVHAPADGLHRWMGSIALDYVGNAALGYNVASSAVYPGVRYAGRLAADPLGVMGQGEAVLVDGAGSQTGSNRWGDYSMMGVDPTDDCTFWYTQEYVAVTGTNTWTTRIGAFKFPTCSSGPLGGLVGQVTDSDTNQGIASAHVHTSDGAAQVFATITSNAGAYAQVLPAGSYTLTVSSFGYLPQSITDLAIAADAITTQDVALQIAPLHTISGQVRDASTGWPLYARIAIPGYPGGAVWTDPLTGAYSVDLPQAATLQFDVSAWNAGYIGQQRSVGPISAAAVEDFDLDIDGGACNAPGYLTDCSYYQDFEAGDGGFTVSGFASWAWGAPASGPGVAHSGQNLWATNLHGDYSLNETGVLESPAIDLSALAGQDLQMSWWQWLETEAGWDYASVEASSDGGASWTRVYGEASGAVSGAWAQQTLRLSSAYAVSDFRLRFRLRSDVLIVAPGFYIDDICIVAAPAETTTHSQDFEANNGGYTVSGASSWAWGTINSGPGGAHSGLRAWATNRTGNYGNNENGALTSPNIDLSAHAGETPRLVWWQWLRSESGYDYASLEVSKDGGGNWTRVYGEESGPASLAWEQKQVLLDPSYSSNGFRLRFRFRSDASGQDAGWYIDDVSIGVSDPAIIGCAPQPGGFVTGHVFDANTSQAIDGALVSHGGRSVTSAATPLDPQRPDGFYTLFAPAGLATISVAATGGYAPASADVIVPLDATVQQDFHLDAGQLGASQTAFEVNVVQGLTTTVTFTLANTGQAPLAYQFNQFQGLRLAPGQFDPVAYQIRSFRAGYTSAATLNLPAPQGASLAPLQAAGDVLQSWPTGLAAAWGLGFDLDSGDVWVGNLRFIGGDDRNYRFLSHGAATGDSIDVSPWVGVFAADMTYNPWTGRLWQMNAGGDDCIHEMDPESLTSTGNSICPAWGISQRGLTYDPTTDTYFAGGWNESRVYRFREDGSLVDAVNVGLAIAGLAYNPTTQHLFVMTSASPSVIYVLDVAGGYAAVGQFTVTDSLKVRAANFPENRRLSFSDFGGAGLSIDCDGNLWAVDQQVDVVYQVASGESSDLCDLGVDWLAETPTSGGLAGQEDVEVELLFDAAAASVGAPGSYYATLKIRNDTPYGAIVAPVTMHVAPCTAPDPPPDFSIEAQADGLLLSWGDVAAEVYEVWQVANDPYFTPGACSAAPGQCTQTTSTSYLHAGGDPSNLMAYLVRAVSNCGAAAAAETRAGAVYFALTPGQP